MESGQSSRFQRFYNGRDSPYVCQKQSHPLIIPGPRLGHARCRESHETVSRTTCFSKFTFQCESLTFQSESLDSLIFCICMRKWTLHMGGAKQHSPPPPTTEAAKRIPSNQTHKFSCPGVLIDPHLRLLLGI